MSSMRQFQVVSLCKQILEGVRQNKQNKIQREKAKQLNQETTRRLLQKYPDQADYLIGFPHATPLFPRAKRLYRQADREVRKALAGWINPWIASPDGYFVLGGVRGVAECRYDWHQIWIDKLQAFRLHFLDDSVEILQGLLQPPTSIQWENIDQQLRWQMEQYQSILEEDALFLVNWRPLEKDLLTAWERCLQQKDATEMEVPYKAFLLQQEAFWELLHLVFIHEFVHSWTKRVNYQVGGGCIYQISGVLRYQDMVPDPDPRTIRVLHESLHEAITEWIAQQIYGAERAYHWPGCSVTSGYCAWLVEKMVLTLNRHWQQINESLPSFPREMIHTAEELLYTIYFNDPTMLLWLEKALAAVSGDEEAFEKLAHACEVLGTTKRSEVEDAQLRQALMALDEVLNRHLEPEERDFSLYFEVDLEELQQP